MSPKLSFAPFLFKVWKSRVGLEMNFKVKVNAGTYSEVTEKCADNQISVIDELGHLSESCLLHFLPMPANPNLIKQLESPKKLVVKWLLIKISS